jgi:hypothetical protein
MFRQTILCAIQGAKLALFFYMAKILARNFFFLFIKIARLSLARPRCGFLFAYILCDNYFCAYSHIICIVAEPKGSAGGG